MRFLLSALAALVLLLAPQAASAKSDGRATTLAERDALIHGIAGDDDYVFVTEPGIGVSTDGPRVVVLDRDNGRQKAVLPAPPGGFKLPFTLRSPEEGKLVVLDAGGFPPQGPPVVYDYAYSDRKGKFSAKLTRTVDFAGLPLGFAEDVEVLPNGEYVVSESVFGGLWLIGRDGTIRPGLVPDPGGRRCPSSGRACSPSRARPSAACRSTAAGTSRPAPARSPSTTTTCTSAPPARAACRRSSCPRCATARGRRRRARRRSRRSRSASTPFESLKGITFNQYDRKDDWIYAGDPFRLQLIRIHSRTGKREVVSTDAKRFNFVTAATFLPPERKRGQASLVTAADQEYRWATLNVALTADQFKPPFIVAEYTPR